MACGACPPCARALGGCSCAGRCRRGGRARRSQRTTLPLRCSPVPLRCLLPPPRSPPSLIKRSFSLLVAPF
eukprot:9548225-Alexandrium_andersonii.AAC.1